MPAVLELDSVTGTVVDTQLRNALTNGADIAGVSSGEPFDPGLDPRSCLSVAEAIEPPSEEIGLAKLDHRITVASRIQHVKGATR